MPHVPQVAMLVAPTVAEAVPAGHSVHRELPAKLCDPAGHCRHVALLLAPMMFENLPAEHCVHVEMLVAPVVAEWVPTPQAVQEELPAEL